MQPKFNNFTLENFDGPLDFLLCLIQKEEIDIYEISLKKLVNQCLEKMVEWKERRLELGAEFIGTMAYFVFLKSRMLLPQNEMTLDEEKLEEDPRFEIIHHLLDYCKFKQTAKDLGLRQEQQLSHFYRGQPLKENYQKPLGIHHLSIDELSTIFKELMVKAAPIKSSIFEENWKVSDKIKWIRSLLDNSNTFTLGELFSFGKTRIELIVTFLALLELMKFGSVGVCINEGETMPIIFAKNEKE